VPKALRGVSAVCPALDLGACADALERTENYLYQRHFVAGLMSRYGRKQKLFPIAIPKTARGRATSVNSTTSSPRRNSAIATPRIITTTSARSASPQTFACRY